MSQEVVNYYEDFKEIEKKIWSLLINAVTDRSSEFRTPVFICGNDKDLDGRVVVLRKADQKNRFVQYHSDIRSSKIEKIKKTIFRINDFMIGMFRGVGIKLIDFKLEFGRTKIDGRKEIILADEISPDTCRLWDSATDKKLDKDRFRKDLGDLLPAYTEVAKRLGILHEQSNVSAVNVTKLSSIKKKRK